MSMNIQRKNSAHHFRMQSEREQTLACFTHKAIRIFGLFIVVAWTILAHDNLQA